MAAVAASVMSGVVRGVTASSARPQRRSGGASAPTPATSATPARRLLRPSSSSSSVVAAASASASTGVMERLFAEDKMEEGMQWAACKALVMELGFDDPGAEKVLVRAYGWGAQNYWRNEKAEEVPDVDEVEARIDYLKAIGIPEENIQKMLTKVPEVLGCDVATRLELNVAHIEKNYFMTRNTTGFVNYVLRVPQVLGNNLDCVGDCAGECNRCWARC
mmetsp:Transcript_23836/g.58459  ORF Transcript_23836/g.58459 Transcript_23836/m.58459 type:complete len:219 (+) Transcript_23836:228-884(+)